MAKYRFVETVFWEDPDVALLTPEQKYFYLYLLTRPQSSQCGVSPFNITLVSAHTGYNYETIQKLLSIFEKDLKKIKYNSVTKEVAIKNWGKYNYRTDFEDGKNEKMRKHIQTELQKVKDKSLINFLEGIDKEIIEEAKGFSDDKNKTFNEIAERIFKFWKITMKHPNAKWEGKRPIQIKARLKEGFMEEECKEAIEGCNMSDYHMGRDLKSNPAGTVYDSIDLIFRNAEHLEKFINIKKRGDKAKNIKDKVEQDKFNWQEAVGDRQ